MQVATMDLKSTIQMPLVAFHLPLIARIDQEDFTGVKRLVSKELGKLGERVNDEYLEEGVLALKQYYVVALLDPKNEHAVSDTIDPFWHAHILHTERYIAFCDEVFHQYVQHVPLDHADRAAVAHVARLYAHTAAVYGRLFGYVNAYFYPSAVPEERLICPHHPIINGTIQQHALFETVLLAV